MMVRSTGISRISALHFAKLGFRSALFLLAFLFYFINFLKGNLGSANLEVYVFNIHPAILWLIWLVFVVEMILRFFPSGAESMGCQKQFARNFVPTNKECDLKKESRKQLRSIIFVAFIWILLNGIIGFLYFKEVIARGVLLLIALAFSVCDMVCILFFCPFHTWIMKNKCCVSCRIYNWDYAMMFTPLLFYVDFYSWSLFGLGLALLIKWEITAYRHPERFLEKANASLKCVNCKEKLCHHKKTLQHFLKEQKTTYSHLLDDHLRKVLETRGHEN